MDFETIMGGDIVAQWITEKKSGMIKETELPIMSTDQGELFVMDAANPSQDGEYPVIRILGTERTPYASDFAQFLEKQIKTTTLSS